MTRNLEEKQLHYLLLLSKTKSEQLLYLLNLNWPTAYKRDELVISKNYFSVKNGVFSLLELEGESRDMDTHSADMEFTELVDYNLFIRS